MGHSKIGLLPDISNCGSTTGYKDLGFKIMNGERAQLGEFPWLALLTFKDPTTEKRHSYCGGSIINQKYILTAAHCLDLDLPEKAVLLGKYDSIADVDIDKRPFLSNLVPPQLITIDKEIVHYSYDNETNVSDIGLIRLSWSIQFNENIRPICLPLSCFFHTKNFEGENVILAGMGNSQDDEQLDDGTILQPGEPSLSLQKVTLNVVSLYTCIKAWEGFPTPISSGHICAGAIGKDACSGDSGGPLMWSPTFNEKARKYFQVGLVSFGQPCVRGQEYFPPGVFTRVSSYMDWILSTLQP